jgi:hypothetical protein
VIAIGSAHCAHSLGVDVTDLRNIVSFSRIVQPVLYFSSLRWSNFFGHHDDGPVLRLSRDTFHFPESFARVAAGTASRCNPKSQLVTNSGPKFPGAGLNFALTTAREANDGRCAFLDRDVFAANLSRSSHAVRTNWAARKSIPTAILQDENPLLELGA